MSEKRVIACVRVNGGRLIVPAAIPGLVDPSDPAEVAAALAKAGADEVYVIDPTATREGRRLDVSLVEKAAALVTVPLVVGGGLRSIDDVRAVAKAGAKKVAINSAAIANSEILAESSQELGNECVVVAVDARVEGAGWTVHTHGGTKNSHIDAITWGQEAEAQGAGEILLTSLDREGTGRGFDVDLAHAVADEVEIPVFIAGGASTLDHFSAALRGERPAGVASASAFLLGKVTPRQVKELS
ncbi:MAG: imidazole glycerol phosphate synthase subunit HisF [Planctomycetes bacterium]|nr:imidazole glycerol phosphate synthase subunit HisF [Planctomycetota bacterium]MBI3845668.1 imidazole glycerol phosphate synthase subunit HisF [Planctomycetota bacterium]